MKTNISWVVVLAVACGPSGQQQPPAPMVLSLTAGKLVLAPGETSVVNALLKPADADSAIVSGELLKGTQSIGVFTGHGDAATWATSATWSSLVDPGLSEGADNTAPVTLTAKFFDAAGRSATSTLQLSLRCAGDTESLCSGRCIDATAAPNCGTCGATCGAPTSPPDGISVPTECRAPPGGGRAACGAIVGMNEQRLSCDAVCGQARAYSKPMVCSATCYMPSNGSRDWTNTWNAGSVAGRAAYSYDTSPTDFFRESLITCAQVPSDLGQLVFRNGGCCCRAQP